MARTQSTVAASAPPPPEERIIRRQWNNLCRMLNQIFSKVIFSLGFDGRLSDFLDPEYPRPWEAEAVLYGKLVRRQPELCDAIIWKKNKNAKKKKKSKQPWQTNKALSTHAMVAQAKVKAVWEDLSCFEGVGETLSEA